MLEPASVQSCSLTCCNHATMKITVKTIKGDEFTIEAEPSETVKAVKGKIEAEKGDAFSADGLKLIWTGKILVNDDTIEKVGLKESDFLVAMPAKKKKKAAITPARTPATPQASNTSADSTPETESQAAPDTPVIAESSSQADISSSSAPINAATEGTVGQLMEMGFPRDQVEVALRASFGNADRAVHYLMNGIPQSVMAEAQPRPEGQSSSDREASGDAEDSAEQAQTPSSAMSESSPLSALASNPNFLQLRAVVQQNPQLLPGLLLQLAERFPELVQQINDNQEDFYHLINDTSGGPPADRMEGGAGGPPPGSIQVTQEEKDAIDRLCALGFDQNLAAQAYFACDKNENLAANYLMEHGHD